MSGTGGRRAAAPAPGVPAPELAAPELAGRPGQLARAAALAWRQQRGLLGNAASLGGATGVTSAIGFCYWAAAARLLSPAAVGYGAAAVSAITLLGTIGMVGLGAMLIGELPRRRGRSGLMAAGLAAAGLGSAVLGLAVAAVAPHVDQRFRDICGTPATAALFAAGVALTAVAFVFDQAVIGLARGGLQLLRNAVFSAAKVMVLPFAVAALNGSAAGITLSWVAGTALSLLVTALRVRASGSAVLARPDWGTLRGLGRTAAGYCWLNLASTAQWSLIPVLVTVVVSPAANAAFYAAWTLAGFLYVIPAHLSTGLFAAASADRRTLARDLRFTAALSGVIGVPAMTILIAGAHLALSIYGAGYARAATLPLCLLAVSYLPMVPIAHYTSVCCATGRVPRAAAVMVASAGLAVIATIAGGRADGLTGVSVALLAAFTVQGLVTAPLVWRTGTGSRGSP